MMGHVDPSLLSALADGELSPDQFALVQEHLHQCQSCTSEALAIALLKHQVAKAGQRYEMPFDVQARVTQLLAQQTLPPSAIEGSRPSARATKTKWWLGSAGWAAAALLLLVLGSSVLLERSQIQTQRAIAERNALANEASDLYIASLAVNQPPQVLSSDRHTVKPWFAGKIPFAFNLPDNLPADTRLEGANLVFLRGAPAAQLIYSVGHHRAAVYVEMRSPLVGSSPLPTEHAGFQMIGINTAQLAVLAVSDMDRERLVDLANAFAKAQNGAPTR